MERLLRTVIGKETKNTQIESSKSENGKYSPNSLQKSIDSFLEKESNSKRFKKISGFHPSQHSTCKRYWYLLFKGADSEKKIPARLQRIFDNGNEVHARWREYFRAMGILIEAEVPISIDNPVPIRGNADGILKWGGRKLYELKSISPERFEFRRVYNKPDAKTYRQTQLYLHATGLDNGFVIYENKGNQEVLIFEIKLDEEFIKKEFRRLKMYYKYVDEDKLPKRPYIRESQQCGDCELENYCWDSLED